MLWSWRATSGWRPKLRNQERKPVTASCGADAEMKHRLLCPQGPQVRLNKLFSAIWIFFIRSMYSAPARVIWIGV